MRKVITYGTYDLLHYGHVRLLERAKSLGDYLIVGVTADDFDKSRGKINVEQSLIERIEGVRMTGLADEIIVEEYDGQKIDDIQRLGVDVFAIGSDWAGKFDYLNEFCQVVYLPRTDGISSSEIRSSKKPIKLGLIGTAGAIWKYCKESSYVNGLSISSICCTEDFDKYQHLGLEKTVFTSDYRKLLNDSDAVYVAAHPSERYELAKMALLSDVHVLCESPMALSFECAENLIRIASQRGLILLDGIKTAYSTAYDRLVKLVKSGRIGQVRSVDSVCTSLQDMQSADVRNLNKKWNSICAWGPTALLPIFSILGTEYIRKQTVSNFVDESQTFDGFSKVDFVFPSAVASIKVGKCVKSEGELVVSGTNGYIYVPAPWWKTDYFEIRYENPAENKRYFYQLDGEGIRNELSFFVKSIHSGNQDGHIPFSITKSIIGLVEDFYFGKDLIKI